MSHLSGRGSHNTFSYKQWSKRPKKLFWACSANVCNYTLFSEREDKETPSAEIFLESVHT